MQPVNTYAFRLKPEQDLRQEREVKRILSGEKKGDDQDRAASEPNPQSTLQIGAHNNWIGDHDLGVPATDAEVPSNAPAKLQRDLIRMLAKRALSYGSTMMTPFWPIARCGMQ